MLLLTGTDHIFVSNSDEEKEAHYKQFVKENKQKIEKFGMLSRWDDCKQYLLENPDLCCEETANYLAIWCLNLQMDEKTDLMMHVSKQVISMQYILELAKTMNCDPRSCIKSFFTKIQTAAKEYHDAFNDELKGFQERIINRAAEKMEAIIKEVEEEERQNRLGPGGLDPQEVVETLPPEMAACFESRDVSQLQDVIDAMEPALAAYHLKRCVDSGLWVVDKKTLEDLEAVAEPVGEQAGDEQIGESDGKEPEPIYDTPGVNGTQSATAEPEAEPSAPPASSGCII